MELRHIPIDELRPAAINMRHSKRPPDIDDILPSIRARGILQPLLVRPVEAEPNAYEIVAGRRRYFSAKAVREEQGEVEPLPCAVMEPGDDAAALEASLIENIARLDPDEMSQYECFARLTREGKSVADIAATFGLTELMVKRRLALGTLIAPIREAYRAEKIDAASIRHLTLASQAKQKEWWKLWKADRSACPTRHRLKQWLFGGQSIATGAALFPLDTYEGEIVADLFGEDGYFADPDFFWRKQGEAIAAKADALREAGWSEVIVMEPGDRFPVWDYEKVPKKKGGKVYVEVSGRGEVSFHEGYLSRVEARRRAKKENAEDGAAAASSARPGVTKAMRNYLELHRHAAVRAELLDHPGIALRLMLAHAIAGSALWQVTPEPQKAASDAIAKSLAANVAECAFRGWQANIRALLGLSDERENLTAPHGDVEATVALFAKLLMLNDEEVMNVLVTVMGETLQVGSAAVEALAVVLKRDMGPVWEPDEAFFELLRDRSTINAMLADIAGKSVADQNVAEKASVQKQIIRDCLAGTNGRTKVTTWLPRWMHVPARAYRDDGGFAPAEAWHRVAGYFGKM